MSGLSTAKEMWRSLEDSLAHKRIVNYNCKKDTSSILNYQNRFRGICDELTAIQKPLSKNDEVS